MIVDYRCPCCWSVLRGKQEVTSCKIAPPKELTCKKCKSKVRLLIEKDDIADFFYVEIDVIEEAW